MERTNRPSDLSSQMQRRKPEKKKITEDGRTFVSTGCTLLDLAVSGRVKRGGGVPAGILLEIFGPSGSGKTVILCELAGGVQRAGGQVMFKDPEARLNNEFSKMFGLDPNEVDYETPSTVTEAFSSIYKWDPEPQSDDAIHGIFTDSLAALSTDLELDNEDGDKMGMRRAKEFSEQLRKVCRIIADKHILLACSNQVRVNPNAGPYGQKYTTPGGQAVGFYASLRLRCKGSEKIKKKKTIKGQEVTRVIGIETEIEVAKSSIDRPHRTAVVPIIFDYGIDDIRSNLKFVKDFTKSSTYTVNGNSISKSIDEAIAVVEQDKMEKRLRVEVIDLWNEVEDKFSEGSERRPRHE